MGHILFFYFRLIMHLQLLKFIHEDYKKYKSKFKRRKKRVLHFLQALHTRELKKQIKFLFCELFSCKKKELCFIITTRFNTPKFTLNICSFRSVFLKILSRIYYLIQRASKNKENAI